MWIINNRKIFYVISIILIVASFAALVFWGLKPGIDFTGGTLIEVSYPDGRPDQADITSILKDLDSSVSARPAGEDSYIIRMKAINQNERVVIMNALNFNGTREVVEKTFDSIGPVLGVEALRKAVVSVILVIVGIVMFITFAFRKVSEPLSSWKYGIVAIVALIHDVIIPVGVFAILGHYLGYEVDTLFVTALLVILGFSVHDTIVGFDRVRENLSRLKRGKSFAEVVGESISQTFTRSINTSLTTLIALLVLYIFGGPATQHFSLALIIGIAAGTYSSIFVGSPLLVTIERWRRNR